MIKFLILFILFNLVACTTQLNTADILKDFGGSKLSDKEISNFLIEEKKIKKVKSLSRVVIATNYKSNSFQLATVYSFLNHSLDIQFFPINTFFPIAELKVDNKDNAKFIDYSNNETYNKKFKDILTDSPLNIDLKLSDFVNHLTGKIVLIKPSEVISINKKSNMQGSNSYIILTDSAFYEVDDDKNIIKATLFNNDYEPKIYTERVSKELVITPKMSFIEKTIGGETRVVLTVKKLKFDN